MTVTWLCESIRLTALWATPEDASGLLNWKSVVGSEPEQRETQPRFGTVREVGPVWGGVAALEFRASPGRADWIVGPVFPPDVKLSGIPNLGPVEETARKFSDLIFDAASGGYPAPRFAIGVIAVHPQSNKEASYAELTGLLRSASLRLEGASDFSYQINRPRASNSVGGLLINRVSRWSAMSSQGLRMQFSMSPTGPTEAPVTAQSPLLYATRVELDINSPPERRDPIPGESRRALLDEFVGLALELLENGDVR